MTPLEQVYPTTKTCVTCNVEKPLTASIQRRRVDMVVTILAKIA